MRRHLHFIAPYALLAMAVVCLVLAMPGCAAMQKQADYSAYLMGAQYERLHNAYERTYERSDAETREWMETNLAPHMDRAKRLAIAVLNAADAGRHVKPEELDALESILVDIALGLNEMGGKR